MRRLGPTIPPLQLSMDIFCGGSSSTATTDWHLTGDWGACRATENMRIIYRRRKVVLERSQCLLSVKQHRCRAGSVPSSGTTSSDILPLPQVIYYQLLLHSFTAKKYIIYQFSLCKQLSYTISKLTTLPVGLAYIQVKLLNAGQSLFAFKIVARLSHRVVVCFLLQHLTAYLVSFALNVR